MKTNNNVIAFYASIIAVLSDETFVESSAEAIVKLAEENKAELSLKDVTVESLRKIYDDHQDMDSCNELIQKVADAAFEDLALFTIKDISARKVFRCLVEMAGTDIDGVDLYSHISNVRYLGRDKSGMAVVTVVVHSYAGLKELLKNPGNCGVDHGHFSSSV